MCAIGNKCAASATRNGSEDGNVARTLQGIRPMLSARDHVKAQGKRITWSCLIINPNRAEQKNDLILEGFKLQVSASQISNHRYDPSSFNSITDLNGF